MAEAEQKITPAEYHDDGSYTIKWAKKPLGFSIVMDTTGNNAYVSSIQEKANVKKGLKLAAQIVEVNGNPTVGKKHQEILSIIKSVTPPVVLRFQPRSFANANSNDQDKREIPQFMEITGADGGNKARINGKYQLVTNKNDNRYQVFKKPVWQKVDSEGLGGDLIYCWYFPKEQSGFPVNLWMIARNSEISKAEEEKGAAVGAYACFKITGENKKKEKLEDIIHFPTDTSELHWHLYENGKFVQKSITIKTEKM